VLEPQFEPVAVRDTTGTLVQGADAAVGVAGVALVWTAPDGRLWSLTGRNVDRADMLVVAGKLTIDGEHASPGPLSLADGTQTALPRVLAANGGSWARLDVPQQNLEPTPAQDVTVWEPSLAVVVCGAGGVESGMSFTTSGLP
jgi:hypothetical protein